MQSPTPLVIAQGIEYSVTGPYNTVLETLFSTYYPSGGPWSSIVCDLSKPAYIVVDIHLTALTLFVSPFSSTHSHYHCPMMVSYSLPNDGLAL